MRSDAAAPVAVVGGGFSGTMVAVHLARAGIPVRLFEPGAEPGRGAAYSTTDPAHLLNVPAAKMSAFPEEPDHFRAAVGLEQGEFARRSDFGAYISAILAAHPAIEVDRRAVVELNCEGEGWRLNLADGEEAAAAQVVLALGNEPPSVPAAWRTCEVITNPWGAEARAAVSALSGEEGQVLLLGTGLTAVDLLLSLDEAGFRGRVLAVSRRGLLPRAHAPEPPAPVALPDLPQGNVRALARWLRRRSAEVGFRAAVDSLRPHSAALWQGWDKEQRRRFLRHARPYWDVHRHRIAPQVAARLKALIAEGRVEIAAARLAGRDGEALLLSTRSGQRRVEPRLIVNCTGPNVDICRTASPLLRSLLESGTVKADPLAIGLATDEEDRAAAGLWALGPLTKGMYWEMTAVPDIRGQAERVARAITKELTSHGRHA